MTPDRNIIAAATTCSILLGLVLLGLHAGDVVDGARLTRDPTDTAGVPWWTGVLSTAGLMVWAGAAATCAAAAACVRLMDPPAACFLSATAALALLLAIDDALQLHETVAPEAGIPELAMYGALGAAAAAWVVRFRRELLASNALLLGLAGIFFAGSLTSDVYGVGPTVAEDWLKYSGLLTFGLWCAQTAVATVRDAIAGDGDGYDGGLIPASPSRVASKSVPEIGPTQGEVTPAAK